MIRQRLLSRWTFFLIVFLSYLAAALSDINLVFSALSYAAGLVWTVIPVILLVFGLIFISNIILTPRRIVRYMGKGSGLRGWLIAMGGGILSSGPIYMWYPLLADLRKKGMKSSLIAAFLYNRAVKIPLMPLMIYYFGWAFTIVLTFYMLLFSIINGLIVGKLAGVKE
jgi:uncharacterized membrane protein YraQ (UPF0718 family)